MKHTTPLGRLATTPLGYITLLAALSVGTGVPLSGCTSARDGKTWVETVGPRWPTTGSSRHDVPTSAIKAARQPDDGAASAPARTSPPSSAS